MTTPRDHIAADLRAAMALADGANDNDTEVPADGYGAGFITYQLASYFHALCCVCGRAEAEKEMAEIIAFERKPR